MLIKVFAILDTKTGIYSHPIFLPTVGAMMRAWVDHANDPRSSICKHPEDYTLFCIGDYDDQTGKFINALTPESLGVAAEVIRGNIDKIQPADADTIPKLREALAKDQFPGT